MSEQNHLISIVVPVYNVETYVEKCLDSIVNQTYKNIEIIVVNDGSLDNSEKIILQFAKKDKRIHYIKRENGGLGAARNTGLDMAKGEYICFIDSDDWINLDYVKSMVDTAIFDGSDMVICNMVYQYFDGSVKPRTPKIVNHELIDCRESIRRLFIGNQYKFHVPNKLYKTYLFHKHNIRFPEGKIYEDVFTTYKLFLEASSVSLLPQNLYYYLQGRANSIMSTEVKLQRFTDMFDALDQIFSNEKIRNMRLENEIQRLYAAHIISLVNYIYPLWNINSKSVLLKYKTILTQNRYYPILAKAQNNSQLNLSVRIRVFLIRKHFLFYCFFMKKAKAVLKNR